MNKVLVVARWEYVEKIKSKAFLIGLFVTPFLMVLMGVLPGFFATKQDNRTKVIGVIDQTGQYASLFADRMEQDFTLPDGQPNYLVEVFLRGPERPVEAAIAEANQNVMSNKIDGYCLIRSALSDDSLMEYRAKNVGDLRLSRDIEETMRNIILEKKLMALGLNPALTRKLNVELDLRNVQISESGTAKESGFLQIFFTAYIFLMMLFFLIMTSGQLLVRSVIEEKSNRIVEVLVSSCSPTELMTGKVLGLSGLGFTQIGFWSVVGLFVSGQFGLDLIDLPQAMLMGIYFILGYLLYTGIFIGLGSPVTTEQEAQQITSYLVILLILPIALALPAIQNPGATWLRILSFIPPLTATIMTLRISVLKPETWEIVVTVLIMLFSIAGAMWAAGRIFKVAILSTGKRPRLREIMEWVRHG